MIVIKKPSDLTVYTTSSKLFSIRGTITILGGDNTIRKRPHVTVTLDEDVLSQVDKARGMISRSRYVDHLLKEQLAREKGHQG